MTSFYPQPKTNKVKSAAQLGSHFFAFLKKYFYYCININDNTKTMIDYLLRRIEALENENEKLKQKVKEQNDLLLKKLDNESTI